MRNLKQSLIRSEPLLVVALVAIAAIFIDQHQCFNSGWFNDFFLR